MVIKKRKELLLLVISSFLIEFIVSEFECKLIHPNLYKIPIGKPINFQTLEKHIIIYKALLLREEIVLLCLLNGKI